MMVLQAHRYYPLGQNGGYCSQKSGAAKSFSTHLLQAFSACWQSIEQIAISWHGGGGLQSLRIPDFPRHVSRILPQLTLRLFLLDNGSTNETG
ncbi:hypothetical protein EGM70_10675 [Enterobacteriaceae bacterium 89]|nr:hypothetical protein [Enterobacteriaceae bacterium 89]